MSKVDEYKLRWRGRESGPFSVEEINRQLDDHEIGMTHEIWHENEWITVEQFLAALSAPPPAPEPPSVPLLSSAPSSAASTNASPLRITVSRTEDRAAPLDVSARNRLVFALLAVFAGFVGLHNFYARQWLTGLLQLLLSVATYLMGFGILAAWVWAIVEAIFVRKDGNGIDMI